jgi:hypothetical protein
MVKICSQCGSEFSDEYKFCKICGNTLNGEQPIQGGPSQNQIQSQDLTQVKKTQGKQTKKKSGNLPIKEVPSQDQIEGQDLTPEQQTQGKQTKKKVVDKYIIGSNQRKVLLNHIIPTLALGSFIWFLGEYFFSTYLRGYALEGLILAFYIFIVVFDAILFIVLYKITKIHNNFMGTMLFFAFCFISGALSLPIVMLTSFESQVHMFVTLSLSADVIVLFMGIVLKENYFAKGHIFEHVVLYLIGCAGALVIFIIAFKIHNFALTIPTALAIISIVSIMLMFNGAVMVKRNDIKQWMFIAVNILGKIILSLFIAAIFVAIAVVIVLLCAAGDGGGIDLGGSSGSGSGSIHRKKKLQQNLKIE